MSRFEIRIPTYRRPHFLGRAIRSVQGQTESDWTIFVLDDSPDGEGAEVVRAIADQRIHYIHNPGNLGAARNIDQAFSKRPRSDADFFTILSDDNLMLPNFLERGRSVVETSGAKIALINEIVVDVDGKPTGQTTRGGWFLAGLLSPRQLYASLFLKEGISDGGLFWTREGKTDLEVGSDMPEVCLQEACRTLKVVEPIYFEPEPAAAFSFLPQDKVVRQTGPQRTVSCGKAAIARYLWRRGGKPMMAEAMRFAHRLDLESELQRMLESSLRPWDGTGLGARDWYWRMRGTARSLCTANPVAHFLSRDPGNFES
jgi:glycosyltransferase involved in cell wall biosynthesis